MAEALGIVPAAPTCDLCEMHPGEAEGLTVAEMQQRWGRNYAAVPGAQYFPDWLPGAQRRLRVLAEQHRGRTVLAVTHNAVVRASFLAFAGMPKRAALRMRVDHTGLTIWTRPTRPADQRRPGWSLERHNDTAHLE